MLTRLRCYFRDRIIDIKNAYKQYQFVFIIVLICFIIGFIAGLGKIESSQERHANDMLTIAISNASFNIFIFYLKLLGYPTIIFLLCFILSFNFYVFYLNFVVLAIFYRFFFSFVFACCVLEGFVAYILLITLWLPIILIITIFYIKYFISMYSLVFSCNRKFIVSYASYWPTTRKMFFDTILRLYLILFIYAGVFLIILNLIY